MHKLAGGSAGPVQRTVHEIPAFRSGTLPPDRCTSGVLAPTGELELDGASAAAPAREDYGDASAPP